MSAIRVAGVKIDHHPYSPGKKTKTLYLFYRWQGRAHMRSAKTSKLHEAKLKARQLADEMGLDRQGVQPFVPDRDKVSCDDLQRIMEDDAKVNPRKAERSMRAALKALKGFFGGMRARAIDHAKLQEYVAHRLAMKRSRGTIRVELATLRRAFRLAARSGRAIVPVFPTVEAPPPPEGLF